MLLRSPKGARAYPSIRTKGETWSAGRHTASSLKSDSLPKESEAEKDMLQREYWAAGGGSVRVNAIAVHIYTTITHLLFAKH